MVAQFQTTAAVIYFVLQVAAGVGLAWAEDVTDSPVPVQELENKLTAVIKNSFEFIDGEIGDAKNQTSSDAGRFWFAKIRPKEAGEFAIACSVDLEFPDADRKNHLSPPDRAEYLMMFKVGERGTFRIIRPGTFGGATYPHLNVGDTLILPIPINRNCRRHAFRIPDKANSEVTAYFSVANGLTKFEQNAELQKPKREIINKAADWLNFQAAWAMSLGNRPGTEISHSLTAVMKFVKPGEIGIFGRLVDSDPMGKKEGTSLHIVKADEPIAVLLEHIRYIESSKWGGKQFTSGSHLHFAGGTIEARVGDRIVFGCGEYKTPEIEKIEDYRPGLIELCPFKAIAPYKAATAVK